MSQHLITTRARTTTCPGCAAPILTAIDAGLPAHVNPTPIPPQQEATILLTGAWTYTHTTAGHLIHRHPDHIRTGQPTGPIHATHKCPTPPLIPTTHTTQNNQQLRAQLAEARTAGKTARHTARLRAANIRKENHQ
jgi:hypothetical protein